MGLALLTLIGLIILWPNGRSSHELNSSGAVQKTDQAEVEMVAKEACTPPESGTCLLAKIKVTSGLDKGQEGGFTIQQSGAPPDLNPGDKIRVFKNPAQSQLGGGFGSGSSTESSGLIDYHSYSFVDFDRRGSMLLLLALFLVAALVVSRLRGAFSLVGLALSLVIVLVFIVPSILDGRSPLAVALVGSMAAMLVTSALAYGFGPKGAAATLGTAAALILTALLGVVFTNLAHLSGFTSEESVFLQTSSLHISLQGLVLAGIVIGALGVLEDLTVTQASTVMVLRRANPAQTARELYTEALEVGHDHISATIVTLVFAYVGASLPILLIFSIGGLSFGEAVNSEVVAAPIIAALVGSIGLIASVPLTTGLAALLASRIPVKLIPDDAHSH
jgi:uncharacterized membrane protein